MPRHESQPTAQGYDPGQADRPRRIAPIAAPGPEEAELIATLRRILDGDMPERVSARPRWI